MKLELTNEEASLLSDLLKEEVDEIEESESESEEQDCFDLSYEKEILKAIIKKLEK